MKVVYFRTWLKQLYNSYKVQTKVRLIGGIAYSQGRQEVGENTVMIETYEDGQTRVTFIYDGSFDFDDGRMEMHNREGNLPEITDEASRGIHFKGFDGPLTGASLFIIKRPVVYLERTGDHQLVIRTRDGGTSRLITKLSIANNDQVNLLQTRLEVPTFQMEIPSTFKTDQLADVNWMHRSIGGKSKDIKTLCLQNQAEGQTVDGFIFEHVEIQRMRTFSLTTIVGGGVVYCGVMALLNHIIPPSFYQWITGIAMLAIWIATAFTFRDQTFTDLCLLIIATECYGLFVLLYQL